MLPLGLNNAYINRFEFLNREKESTFGLNTIRLGARGYNPTSGRFDRIDPVIQEQESYSLYQYSYNNPIMNSDPNGDCPWCVGAIVGGVLDAGLQLAEIAFDDNKKLSDFSFTSVPVSAASGALGVGFSTKIDKALKVYNLGKLALATTKVASELATDATLSASGQIIKEGKVSLKKVAIDAIAGQAVKPIANKIVAKASNTPVVKQLTRDAERAERIASQRTNPSRQAAKQKQAEALKKEADSYTQSRGVAASVAGSGVISTAVEKVKKKLNQ